jgi:hypothetical protein
LRGRLLGPLEEVRTVTPDASDIEEMPNEFEHERVARASACCTAARWVPSSPNGRARSPMKNPLER